MSISEVGVSGTVYWDDPWDPDWDKIWQDLQKNNRFGEATFTGTPKNEVEPTLIVEASENVD